MSGPGAPDGQPRVDVGGGAPSGSAPDPVKRVWRPVLRWLLAVLALVAVLVAGIVGYLALNASEIAERIVSNVPLEQELALGELGLAEARLRVKLADTGPAVDAVRAVGGRLTRDSRFRYRWFVAARPEVNAVALPGGIVIVFAGLIEAAASPEELAAVLAHEVAHAELRHALRASVQQIGLSGLAGLFLGGAGDRFADAATTLGERKFSRDAEQEADRDGLRRLVAARIDPRAMPRIYARLAEKPPAGLMATHPATAGRIAALEAEIARLEAAGLPSPEALVIDWPLVQAALRR
jgi:beta-barrel assembly-enhancing protease